MSLPCSCDGSGDCEKCHGTGWVAIEGCPRRQVDSQTRVALRLASWADKGVMPEPGALMDQDIHTLAMIEFIASERRRILNHASKP